MNNDPTPTYRKQKRVQIKQPTSIPIGENESVSMLPEGEMTSEQLWHKWETEARQQPLTPQEEWQLDMNQKALEEMQKVNPMIAHAFYIGEPISLTPTDLEALQAAFRTALQKR